MLACFLGFDMFGISERIFRVGSAVGCWVKLVCLALVIWGFAFGWEDGLGVCFCCCCFFKKKIEV